MSGLMGLESVNVTDLYAQNVKYYNELAGEKIKFDLLKLYFGEDYVINEGEQGDVVYLVDTGELAKL